MYRKELQRLLAPPTPSEFVGVFALPYYKTAESAQVLSMKTLFIISLVLLSLISSQSWSADFDKGAAAFFNGDYVTALRELKPLAEQGDAASQWQLGSIIREFTRGTGAKVSTKKYFCRSSEYKWK